MQVGWTPCKSLDISELEHYEVRPIANRMSSNFNRVLARIREPVCRGRLMLHAHWRCLSWDMGMGAFRRRVWLGLGSRRRGGSSRRRHRSGKQVDVLPSGPEKRPSVIRPTLSPASIHSPISRPMHLLFRRKQIEIPSNLKATFRGYRP